MESFLGGWNVTFYTVFMMIVETNLVNATDKDLDRCSDRVGFLILGAFINLHLGSQGNIQ